MQTARAHRLLVSLAAVAASIAARGTARATAGTAFGETSRAASLASSVSARAGDAGTILLNPAGLADVQEPVVLLSGHAGRLEASFARTGEPGVDRSRWFGGYSLAAATPLPGPEWLRRVRVGLALDVPAQYALRVSVSERADQPTSPTYDGRPDRMSALGAIAIAIGERLRLGGGVALTPSLDTPTEVSYAAGRDPSVDRSVVVRLDRDLRMDVAPFVGLRAQATRALSFGVVYRSASVSRAGGNQRTVAGGILADDPIDFYEMWDPAELVLGAAFAPTRRLSLSADVTLHRWSQFKSGLDRDVVPAFTDTWSVRGGAEWRSSRSTVLRAGLAFEPTPIGPQVAETNYLDADAVVLALGLGVDLRKAGVAPLAIDAHWRARVGATQTAVKRDQSMPDASPDLPGRQIDNLGYPGFRSRAGAWQLGLTVTFFVGKETRR